MFMKEPLLNIKDKNNTNDINNHENNKGSRMLIVETIIIVVK